MDAFLTHFDLMHCKKLLEEEQVTLEALALLSEDDLKALKIPMGSRRIILDKVPAYLASLKSTAPAAHPTSRFAMFGSYPFCHCFGLPLVARPSIRFQKRLASCCHVFAWLILLAVVAGPLLLDSRREKELGGGAFGVVWRARNKANGEVIALKRVRVQSSKHEEKLRREVDAYSRLHDFTHVVRLLEWFDYEDSANQEKYFYFALEFCDLGDMNTLITNPPDFVEKACPFSFLSYCAFFSRPRPFPELARAFQSGCGWPALSPRSRCFAPRREAR